MNDITTIQEGMIQMFSNNPIILGKWLLVFISFVLTFVVRIKFKIDDKLDPYQRLDEKVKKAIENNHIINAKLIKKYVKRDENSRKTFSGKYEYQIDGKKYNYTALFAKEQYPRRILHLYYEKTPKKLFTNEEYHYYVFKGLPLLILNFSPFIVGAFMVWILGLVR